MADGQTVQRERGKRRGEPFRKNAKRRGAFRGESVQEEGVYAAQKILAEVRRHKESSSQRFPERQGAVCKRSSQNGLRVRRGEIEVEGSLRSVLRGGCRDG